MPRYDYECQNCKQTIEIIHSIKIAAKKKCPKCGKRTLQKLINKGVGLIFKGDGFYRSIDYINDKAKENGIIHSGEPGSHSRKDGG